MGKQIQNTASDGPPVSRNAILESALTEFATNGYAGAKTRDIAKRANVNHAMIKYYFGNKEQLWKEAVDLLFDRFDREMALTGAEMDVFASDPKEYLKLFVRKYIKYCAAYPEHARIMILDSVHVSERLQWAVQKHVHRAHKTDTAMLRAGIEEGYFPSISLVHFAYMLIGACQFVFAVAPQVKRTWGQEACEDRFVEDHIEAVLAVLFADENASMAPA